MTEDLFKPAERKARPLKLALFGPSKSGKTLTALKLMRGIVGPNGKYAVADTENDGALEYLGLSDVGEFSHRGFSAPYTAERFVKLLVNAWESGYQGIIVDGITPLWDGPGGIQALVDANDHGYGSGWKVGNPAHQQIIRAIIDCPIHLICTMRSKTAYATEGGNDKFPKKVGLKPVQREGIEYEFRLLGELDMDNHLRISGRQGFQNRVVENPGAELARELLEYLGAPEPPPEQEAPAGPPTAGATTAPPQAGTTQPAIPGTDSVPAPVAAGNVSMTSPGGDELVTVPAESVAALQAAGWVLATPPPSPVTPVVPSEDSAPVTATPAPAAPPEAVSTPPPSAPSTTIASGGAGQVTGTESASPASAPGGEQTPQTTNGHQAAKMEASQLQAIMEACQELAMIAPDKGDASWWMDWANKKSVETYNQDFGSMTRDNAAGLLERLEKTKLALKAS